MPIYIVIPGGCLMSEPTFGGSGAVPGWTPEFGTRLRAICDQIGGLSKASKIAGVTAEQIAKWRDGVARPPLFPVASLAVAAGVSLDWIVTGGRQGDGRSERVPVESRSTIRADILGETLGIIEEWLAVNNRTLEPNKKSEIVSKLYQLIIEEIEAGENHIDKRTAHRFLRLVV